MFYIRPRKNESIKGFYICYKEHYGYMTSHYVEDANDIDDFLDSLEDSGMTPEQMDKVRVYPALSWRFRNAFFDKDGDLRFWAQIVGALLVSAIVAITIVFSANK